MQARTADLRSRILTAVPAIQARGEYASLRTIAREVGVDPDNNRHGLKIALGSLVDSGEVTILPRSAFQSAERDRDMKAKMGELSRKRTASFRRRMTEAGGRLQARGVFPSPEALAHEMGLKGAPSGGFRKARRELIDAGVLPSSERPSGCQFRIPDITGRLKEAVLTLQAEGKYPGHETLGSMLGCSDSTAKRVRDQLVALGEIRLPEWRVQSPKPRKEPQPDRLTLTPKELADRIARVRVAKRRKYAAGGLPSLTPAELDAVLPL